jgi:hypothetical protein
MIVYGDPQFVQTLSVQVRHLRERVAQLCQDEPSLDDVRELLVQAGQLEQAVLDALPAQLGPEEAQQWIERCQSFTDGVAKVYYGKWLETQHGTAFEGILLLLHLYLKDIETWPLPDVKLRIKLPEGFAFYTLFPEAYAASALRWMDEHAAEKACKIAVIGVRSIGTSLSALMKVALQSKGWDAHRLTVRPTGHPFAREVHLEEEDFGSAEWFLIVDEGPGLSGSSMASVAQALHERGVARERIVFFPGHGGEPGQQASSSTRSWWNTTARYVTTADEMRWHGQTLPEVLAGRTRELLSTTENTARIEDLSGGLWRAIEYSNQELWPPISPQFERSKLRVTLNDGRAVLWKFAGFVALENGTATEEMQRQLAERAANGFTVAPLGSCCGFVATPWIEGQPLTRQDATPQLLAHLGRYIADSCGEPLSSAEAQTSRQRLAEMLSCNTRKALGEEAAKRAQFWSEPAPREPAPREPAPREPAPRDELAPTYGDGHLAPHEWIRTSDNRVLKTDCCGHDWDHTVIGRQSWLWDVAGALVEWNLDAKEAAPLLSSLFVARVQEVSRDELRFHYLSYAAFRLGMLAMSAQNTSHREAVEFYRQALQRGLNNDFEYSIASE